MVLLLHLFVQYHFLWGRGKNEIVNMWSYSVEPGMIRFYGHYHYILGSHMAQW